MRLNGIPAALKAAGVPYKLVAGWETRGSDFVVPPKVVVGHHTATPDAVPGDVPTLGILVRGRSDLKGPLCQVALSRSGVAYVVASGRANHAGKGQWLSFAESGQTVGIEVENAGQGKWTAKQLATFDRVAAALLKMIGAPAGHYCGHREWARPAGRKIDPAGVDLDAQRARIAKILNPPRPPAPRPGPRPTLRIGMMDNPHVRELQRRLRIAADGDFGPGTERAVKAFQKRYHLTADGVVGPNTWAVLAKVTKP